ADRQFRVDRECSSRPQRGAPSLACDGAGYVQPNPPPRLWTRRLSDTRAMQCQSRHRRRGRRGHFARCASRLTVDDRAFWRWPLQSILSNTQVTMPEPVSRQSTYGPSAVGPHAASPSHSAHQPHNESRLFSALRCTLPRVSTLKLCSSRLAALFRNLLLRAPPSSAPGLKWRHQQIFALIFKALEIATTQVRPILRGHMSIWPGWRWVSPVRGVASLHSLVPRPSVHTVETWYAQMASGGRESKACRL
ncbi:hypothetical protein IAQ61_006410, partial [Plenodomus lingam]|uniref:uncharacterized protein n=1 Tax=Leptosphaeria maculans TaxID=5022 RepID=UPI003325BD50